MYALTIKLHQSINEHQKPLAIFLDLAKAFDTVSHAKLIQKLNSYGIRGICGDLLRDYLSNRKQVVSINSVLSEDSVNNIWNSSRNSHWTNSFPFIYK